MKQTCNVWFNGTNISALFIPEWKELQFDNKKIAGDYLKVLGYELINSNSNDFWLLKGDAKIQSTGK